MPTISQRGLQLIPSPTDDPQDPLRWPSWLKLSVILSTSLANFVSNMGGAGLSVAVPLLMQQFQRSQGDVTQLLTLNFLFLGIGNIFWVPVAVKFGKRASLISSMLLQAGALIWCAVAGGYDSLLGARCVLGFAAAAGESIVPEVVADIFFVHERATMMAIYVVLISGGSAVGPLVGGFMVQYTSDTWRSFVWLCFALAIFNVVLLVFLFPECNFERPEPLTSMQQLQTAADCKENEATFIENASEAPLEEEYTVYTPSHREVLRPVHYDKGTNFFLTLISPLKLLIHPSILWGIFTYGVSLSPQIIMIFTMSPLLEAPPYHFRSEYVGLMQIAAIVGFLLACYGGGYLSDVINSIVVRRSGKVVIRPEQRLVSLLPGMAIGPAGCILLAFACGQRLHWSAIAVGFGMVSFGTVYTPNIAITYIVHLHQHEAAKSLVLINIFKNLVAFIFLYVAVDWVNKEGAAGEDCERFLNIRFRNGLDFVKDQDVSFPEKGAWPPLTGPIRFYDETLEIERLYIESNSSSPSQESHDTGDSNGTHCGLPESDIHRRRRYQIAAEDAPVTHQTSGPPNRPSHASLDTGNPIVHHGSRNAKCTTETGRNLPNSSDFASSQTQYTSLSAREAALFRNFVDNMALWTDITDPQRHFETVAPARALHEPVLRAAILAFSSRHINRQRSDGDTESLKYHNQCLQLLIPTLSCNDNEITEELLAAVAILRQNEEMDPQDNQFHLTGTTRILNTMSSFGSSGGLGEAAAWLCLREDMYISLTSQSPLRTNLQSFEHSDVFTRTDDFAWSNRMVFLLARILSCAFNEENRTRRSYASLDGLEKEVDDWNSCKPRTFQPVRFVPRGRDSGQRFPIIWTLLPVHVVGLQYFHIAKIILVLSGCASPFLPYENLQRSRDVEKLVRGHLLNVLGLAASNPRAENTLFTARHSLVAWGWILRHRLDQEAAEELLRYIELKTGWNTSHLIDSLREQWQNELVDD
ncbi:uncharacterized protein CDV56_103435 [Aspergillus thermomutatus]|uniref:Major facilitator superfamily (MFS) profile domain-containing protein n=1 Tax=Aspergillus thermomutatus TaxID=41047 RepID=A0A397G299_ASPTH|nr:uncharacterized protein CDV56_103435 [Aspergillus thermomutatus]RHZ45161.1 hypothetical protein CDV56_103435 [Aspergillus thermomutatus]